MIETVKFNFGGGTEIYARIFAADSTIDFDEIEDAINSYLDAVDSGTAIQLVEDVLDSFPWDYSILCEDCSKVTPSHIFLI